MTGIKQEMELQIMCVVVGGGTLSFVDNDKLIVSTHPSKKRRSHHPKNEDDTTQKKLKPPIFFSCEATLDNTQNVPPSLTHYTII